MSTPSSRFTLHLPDYWTPEQALAAYDLLSDLRDAIWNCYELPLIDLLQSELNQNDPSQSDLFDFDDPIPF